MIYSRDGFPRSPLVRLALFVLAAGLAASPAVAGRPQPSALQPAAITGRVTAGHSAAAVAGRT